MKIYVFDIDDTLMICHTKIEVRNISNNEIIDTITSQDIKNYNISSDIYLDYTNFRSFQGMMNCELLPTFNTLTSLYYQNATIAIITARADRAICQKWFKKHNINIPKNLIFAINDELSEYKGSTAERKKQAFIKLCKLGYDEFEYYDDDINNIEAVKKVCEILHKQIKTITI